MKSYKTYQEQILQFYSNRLNVIEKGLILLAKPSHLTFDISIQKLHKNAQILLKRPHFIG